jgi:hypothetical protein
MRAYVRVSSLLFALVSVGHLSRVAARWLLVIAGQPLPAVASLVVLLLTGAMAIWEWRLLRTPQAAG